YQWCVGESRALRGWPSCFLGRRTAYALRPTLHSGCTDGCSCLLLPAGMQFNLIALCLVFGDELIGNVIQVVADDLRLRPNLQNIVTGPPNQRCFPSGRHGSERIPRMAGDKTKLRRLDSKLLFDIGVSLA